MDLFKQACWLACQLNVHRYLMSNAQGRHDGAEKAQRHAALCCFYVAAIKGVDNDELVRRYFDFDFDVVHRTTQELTDNLDEAIGFPLNSTPDYEELAPLFFEKFHELALKALRVKPSKVIGYHVKNIKGEHWGDRLPSAILDEATALKELAQAEKSSDGPWLMIALRDGDVDKPSFI